MAQLYSKEQLREIFQSPFNQEAWKAILHNLFRAELIRKQAEKFTGDDDNEDGYFLGALNTSDSFRIGLFYFVIKTGSVAHKKVGLRNLVKQFVNPTWGEFDAAIVVFNDKREWRLSFVCDIKDVKTAPKRYTFVFGEHDNFYRTAIDRFLSIQNSEPTFENIRKAFSVDALSDDFFDTYRKYYADFVQYITGKRYVKEGNKWVERELGKPNFQYTTTFDCNDKLVRDYVKKMFGRIVFLYFLQRKGWLNGDRQYMHNLFYDSTAKDNFLDGVLEPLFFEVLNTDKQYRTADANALPGSENIPYLNGGLFARDEIDELDCVFPEDYFKKLFDFLDSYNFTIDENDVDDAEIGIDPEMLGRIFENLLEDNKDKGAFYTPKEIVNYMCRESLIAYLQNGVPERSHELIRNFVENCDASQLNADQSKYLRKKLQAVKICDPAIGSGAFPMGLVNILSRLYIAMKADTDTSKMKRHIIENNIYGVDIEKGAVDIARLRFWLAMIVEEKEPMPLPNLHFKIMQGNSLLESIDGIDLSDLTKTKAARNLFDSTDTERENLKTALSHYYNTSNHTERDRLFNEIINNVRRQIYAKDPNIEQSGLDPSANDKFFLWHTWFADVFDNGGFDIVIGNPPYIEFKNYPKSEKDKLCHYITAKGKYDLYIPFIEMGINLLKKRGSLSYICPTRFMKRDYGRALRAFINTSAKIGYIIDFTDVQIFENAMTYTGIFNIINDKPYANYLFGYSQNLDNKFDIITSEKLNDDVWEFSIGTKELLLQKIKKNKPSLYDICDGIIQGIATGKDSVFLVQQDTIRAYNLEKELLHPFLKGKDISPYFINWSGFYVIYPYDSNGKVIDEKKLQMLYPNTYTYLESQREQLKGRGYFDRSTKLWFELWNQRKPSKFEGEKLVTLDNASKNSFALDTESYFGTTTVYNIKITDPRYSTKYVLAILNSKVLDFYHKAKSIPQANGFYRYQAIFIKALPIAFCIDTTRKRLEELVTSLYIDRSDYSSIITEIDHIVYHLYDLTYDEVLVIDPDTPITHEEYNKF